MRTSLVMRWLALFLLLGGARGAPAEPRPWDAYRVIMWTGDSAWRQPDKVPLYIQRLRELGVTHGMVHGQADPQPWLAAGMPYYVENMVNRGLCLKWNSRVRDWDAFVTRWAQTRDRGAFVREYPLYDAGWRQWAHGEMRTLVTRHRAHAPLAYDLRDELSITQSANPFDYDFAPPTLAALRGWLRARYGSLPALNAAWETTYPSWDAVLPFTTDEIKNRMAGGAAQPRGQPDWQALAALRYDPAAARRAPTRWNLSPWCDFRTFLDETLATLLDELRRTARELDPATPVGIEGTQMPSAFGGYDLWRLSQALDWAEPYDIGGARAIFGSFMEGKPLLSTIGEADARLARRRLWHLLLEGDRGCIVWWSEDCFDWKSPDYAPTPKGRALAPVFKELTGPLAAAFVRARREYDPVAIHYSQPSIQVDWLIESTVDGRTWHRRFSSYEAGANRLAAQRVRLLRDLRTAGFSPRFLSSAQLESGALAGGAWRAVVLPGSLALSEAEARALRAFAGQAGCRLVYDGEPGAFDEHGRLRPAPLFDARPADTNLATLVAGVARPLRVEPEGAGVAVYRYRLGAARLVALECETGGEMGEDLKVKERLAADAPPRPVRLVLENPAHVYDLRAARYLGHTASIALTLDPWQPTLLALLPAPVAPETLPAALAP